MSIFKKRKQRKLLKEQSTVINMFNTINAFADKGLLAFDAKLRRLYISNRLACFYIFNNGVWRSFLSNLHTWTCYNQSTELWHRYFKDVESKAVRAARRKYASLSSAEELRIRQKARQEVDVTEVDAPEIAPFDIVITDEVVFSPDAKVIVVGRYDDGDITLAPYDDIRDTPMLHTV